MTKTEQMRRVLIAVRVIICVALALSCWAVYLLHATFVNYLKGY